MVPYFMLAFISHGCVLGGQATKSTVCVRPKYIFCVNFGQEGHLPTQHPGFDSKLSSKGKPGTCELLETLQSPVNFFRRAKLLGLLYKFCILHTVHIFVNIDGFFYIR
jgi:hypothetical protein